MCHSLVMNYGLYKRMEIFVSEPGAAISFLLLLQCCFLILIDRFLSIDSALSLRRSAK
jgi:hypothetical protein